MCDKNASSPYEPEIKRTSPEDAAIIRRKKTKKEVIPSKELNKSSFELARITIIGFFSTLTITVLSLSICDMSGLKSDNVKWAMDKFLNFSSPVVTAVTFYYFGKNSQAKSD